MTKIIGHRGAKGVAQENTLASIQKAIELGVGEIEFDVRVTKDGVPILNHDPVIHNLAGKKFRIDQHTLAELRQFTSGIATLKEAARAADHKLPLLIEVKPRVRAEPIIESVKELLAAGWKPSELAFCSFSQRTLRTLQKGLPGLRKVVNEDYSVFVAMYRARQLNTKHISMEQRYLWSLPLKILKKRGYHVNTYALNNAAKAARWERHGLAGVITDHPERFIVSEESVGSTAGAPEKSLRADS
jgi:glycerophosphoryl diester phosphodiesterase